MIIIVIDPFAILFILFYLHYYYFLKNIKSFVRSFLKFVYF